MNDQQPESKRKRDEIEYVGAPTEFADADEVPEWVANIAKLLFFLPSVLITASTIPLVVLGIMFALCMCLVAFGLSLNAF